MTHEHDILTEILTEERRVVRSGATMQEYLAFENASEERHEFHNGDIIIMPGNTGYHEELNAELITLLLTQVRGRARVFGSNLKTMIPTSWVILRLKIAANLLIQSTTTAMHLYRE